MERRNTYDDRGIVIPSGTGIDPSSLSGVGGTIRLETSAPVAVKFDTNKVPLELLPTPALEAIAEVLAAGKVKYSAWNWANGFMWTRLLGATFRHLFAWARGEDKDPETGLSHLAHAGCCILFLLTHERCKLGTDDRFKLEVK